MVGYARKKSASGLYHIMMRGINRQDIFFDDEDYCRFLEIMNWVKESRWCVIYGYCLMGIMFISYCKKMMRAIYYLKRIGMSYAWWCNQKYDRVGQFFRIVSLPSYQHPEKGWT
ncbi:hypothetical protein [Sporomusa sp. KB1]|jgi:hypothetical protein|uniref:hypothetical protein n=1 Tax=Sporomusa sp. KB1 TaxID=943346 RepID=UPI00119FF0F2|nr:hypothetical protein [Sporomusa sp. KB1]TWH46571.1 hypothetical protein Salpa_2565 [Sporomusa sp. KB1]